MPKMQTDCGETAGYGGSGSCSMLVIARVKVLYIGTDLAYVIIRGEMF